MGAVSTARPGGCPSCRKQAHRVHSTYQHSLEERPLGSRRAIVRLRVRRYLCDRKSCFRNRMATVDRDRAQRPSSARLCRRLLLTAGRTRLLGLLTAPTVRTVPRSCWAWTSWPCVRAAPTAPCWSTSRPTRSWACCPTAPSVAFRGGRRAREPGENT
ncbi:transposase family protein [Streptomyces canus]|uniref:transposase family protein n=1 Tax=Streptomyces canus TaxID=58343 RepID=UPI000D12A737